MNKKRAFWATIIYLVIIGMLLGCVLSEFILAVFSILLFTFVGCAFVYVMAWE